ncbi:MAG: DUF542 domain-containing protein [Clostridia bacterium]|nr:DUF542 domain-containing protein [Clostridia bacterium]
MKYLDLNQTIGDSVARYPELARVYMKYGVDFCCGGDRSVGQAINNDTDEGISLIDEAEKAIEFSDSHLIGETRSKISDLSSALLIEHIKRVHHAYLKEELPLLSSLLFKILNVHGINHPELFDIHRLFSRLKADLESHLVKEEVLLFPALIEDNHDICHLIDELEKEHDAAGEALHQLTALTDHFRLPADACKTYQLTYDKLELLVSDMYLHVHAENSILFKRFC